MKERIRSVIRIVLFAFSLLNIAYVSGQADSVIGPGYKIIKAGPQYNTSSFHQKLWGKHYRKEWNTPVRIPLFYLDTASGGLIPYASGGGRQSQTLRLQNKDGKEYVLRSIDKTLGGALPEIFHNTFIENILNDQVSTAHPYAALTIPQMAEAAKIYHTWPQIVYVPEQKALDSFNKQFGNGLYLFEQRPDENWEEAANFGNPKNIIGTENLLEKIKESPSHRVDQVEYVRARLFDMVIGDWGRHEDQWRWASFKQGDQRIYKPIPRDRDQVYTKFDGLLVSFLKSAVADHLQSFDYNIKEVETYNFPARNLDRQMANKTTLKDWKETAKELKSLLTDQVIENSIKQLPPEVFSISGNEIIAKIKSRRDQIEKYASDYYLFLAEEVEIVGTKQREYIEVLPQNDGGLTVSVFEMDVTDKLNKVPFYSRTFSEKETKEIRIYGFDGQDHYDVKESSSRIKIRLIGGPGDDEYKILGGSKVHIYDSKDEEIERSSGMRLHLSNDTSVHQFKYSGFEYDDKGISPSVMYSRDDRIYVGIGYKIFNEQWRKDPFGQSHKFFVRYSLNQNAFNVGYEGVLNQAIGKWNVLINAAYDWVRWTNFFGTGNETKKQTDDANFYRFRSRTANAGIGLNRKLGQGSITVSPYFQTVELIEDDERFLFKDFFQGNGHNQYVTKSFGGGRADINLQRLNDYLVPTRGINFSGAIVYGKNLKENRSFTNYSGNLQLYIPLVNRFVLNIESGAATVKGQPEFYQLNAIGGKTLKGYRRERFWGETVFHNNNELQYIFNVKSRLFNGKAGLLGFVDQGRVWMKGEKSSTWHYGYGGGFMLAPFNRVFVSVKYGMSKDGNQIHLDFKRAL